MKTAIRWALLALPLTAMTVLATEEPGESPDPAAPARILGPAAQADAAGSASSLASDPRAVIRRWPRMSRKAAQVALEEYGPPDSSAEFALVWRNKGPWKRIIAHRLPRRAWLFFGRKNVLEQSAAYRVPPEKEDDLKAFDPRIVANRERNELSFRSDEERWNFLALNLADEVIVGWKTPREARAAYRRLRRLAETGKTSPYTEGLRF